MNISSSCKENMELMNAQVKVVECFDIIERTIIIGGKNAAIYYLSGFVRDEILEQVLKNFFINVSNETMGSYKTINDFINNEISHVPVDTQKDLNLSIDALLAGQTLLFIDGYDSAIVFDMRSYAGRSTSEPSKEKTLRGAKDGFVEKIIFNTALIRRRIRDARLICDMHSIGYISKTDVCLVYMDGIVDKKALDSITQKLNSLSIGALTVGDQSLVDSLNTKNWFNPLPKIRYTERPDVACAHIVEGKIIVLVDNSPTAIILPTGIFDFLQDVNDYYFPLSTGNYLRLIRNVVIFFNIFLIPVYILYANGNISLPASFEFIRPKKPSAVSITTQFLILEIAVDGLKLASLNTPNALGSSLSVIGGLILGQYAVSTGWFTNETILYSAVVTLAGFAQPSIEMNYAFKFMRMILVILCGTLGWWGLIIGTVGCFIIAATTKTITGDPYFYPLVPFDWKKLKNLIFTTRISNKVQEPNK